MLVRHTLLAKVSSTLLGNLVAASVKLTLGKIRATYFGPVLHLFDLKKKHKKNNSGRGGDVNELLPLVADRGTATEVFNAEQSPIKGMNGA